MNGREKLCVTETTYIYMILKTRTEISHIPVYAETGRGYETSTRNDSRRAPGEDRG